MFFDLRREIQTNGAFRHELTTRIEQIKVLDELEKRGRPIGKKRDALVRSILRLCKYNASLLVPMLWPSYPQDEAFSMLTQPYGSTFLDFTPGGSITAVTGRQAGKSSALIVRGRVLSDLIPNYGTLYVAPHPEQVKTYANRFREMERAYRYPIKDQRFRQNLTYKEYPSGSKYEMLHILENSAPARGKTVDENHFDEYQQFNESLELDVLQTQKASKFKTRIYTGTATVLDSPLSCKYDLSSGGVFHIICPVCGGRTDMGDKQHAVECMRIDGMYCVPCRRKGRLVKIDPTNAEEVHARPGRLAMGFKGIHVPQIIIPRYVLDKAEWVQIYSDFVDFGDAKFLQEICGIPVEEGLREITRAHLIAMCESLGDINARKKLANSGHYRWIASGCDWGGSDYRPEYSTKLSYTYHCIIGRTVFGQTDILHFRRYDGMDYRDIIQRILQDHKDFKGGALASDVGAGAAYNMLLRESMSAMRHFMFNLVGNILVPLAAPRKEHMFNTYSLNRTDSLTTLFQAIRNKKIRCFDWNEAEKHLMQFLNAYRVPIEAEGGNKFRFIKPGTKADDAMQACNFAYVLIRMMSGESIVEDPSLANTIRARLEGRDDAETGGWSTWPITAGHEAF